MALGCKVQNSTRLVLGQQLVDQRAVTNIPLHKHMTRISFERIQVGQIAGISQLVEVDHLFV